MGHSRVFKDTVRLFRDKRLKDISLLGRIFLGIPATILGGIGAKLTRADYYNPFTKTLTVYSDVPAIARHELGHAEDFQRVGSPTLYSLSTLLAPPIRLWKEARASYFAHVAAPKSQKWQTGRYLAPAFATYLAGFMFNPITLGLSNIIGKFAPSWSSGTIGPMMNGGPAYTIGNSTIQRNALLALGAGHVAGNVYSIPKWLSTRKTRSPDYISTRRAQPPALLPQAA